MQISTRLCPHRVYFYARSRKTRLKSSFANAVGNGIYICEVTFAVLSQRATTGTMCRACYTKLQTNDACLHPDSPSASPPETVHHTSISSGKRDAFPLEFSIHQQLCPSGLCFLRRKKIGNFLKTPLKNGRTTKRKI